MQCTLRRLRATTAAVLLAAGFVACGDDDDLSGPPATPPAPTGLTAAASATEEAIVLSWTAVTGATSYVLERSSVTPDVFGAIGGSITGTTFTDTDIAVDASYRYRVAAVNANGTGTFSSAVSGTFAGPKVQTITEVTASRTLFSDTVYTLSGFVKVSNGSTLTIQPGTTIVGDPGVLGSSLWILRGSRIDAQGTAEAPIVFTSGKPAGSRAPGDWGGVLIVGNGAINRSGEVLTEGPQGVTEIYSGGNNNQDNSGTLRYVRIEFAGFDISAGGGQELNSLSMYAVGSGTTVEYVQSLAGLDDGFEWWGGAVDGRFLVSYEAGDDHFDWTEGYRGRNQFLIAFQSVRLDPAPDAGEPASDPEGFEADGCNGTGCDLGFASQPFSIPVFANFTLVGPGTATAPSSSGDLGMVLRRGTGGYLTNGIVARWQSQGLSIRDPETGALMTADSLNLSNILLAENAENYDEDGGSNFGVASAFTSSNHVLNGGAASALFTSLTPASLDWTPPGGSPAASGAGTVVIPPEYTANFFGGTLPNTTYFGAADPAGPKWWEGWTNYATN